MSPLEALMREEQSVLASFKVPAAGAADVSNAISAYAEAHVPIGEAAELAPEVAAALSFIREFPLTPYMRLVVSRVEKENVGENEQSVWDKVRQVEEKHGVSIDRETLEAYLLGFAERIVSGQSCLSNGSPLSTLIPVTYLRRMVEYYKSQRAVT